MSDRDPQRLEYARHLEPVRFDDGARSSFLAGVFAPVVMLIFAAPAVLVAEVSSGLVGSAVPKELALVAGVILADLFAGVLPVMGLAKGVVAIRRMRTTPCRNAWQAFAGVAINAVLLTVFFVVLYRCLR